MICFRLGTTYIIESSAVRKRRKEFIRMAKSPISLLQEFSVKNGYFPIYYINPRPNENYSQFVCRVVCKELSCNGIGNSKKEAKHNAAAEMLSLLGQKNEISLLSSNISLSPLPLSPPVVNQVQNSNCVNYIGLLQEYCVQRKLKTQDISYTVVDDSGPSHLKSFTIEVNVRSLRAKGTAQCKKTAKHEAAKNLLQSLNLDITKLEKEIKNENCQEMLEDNIRKLGTEISECVGNESTPSITELSKRSQLLYVECTHKAHKVTKQNFLKDFHSLFEKTYSSKITYNMKQKMQIIRDTYISKKDLIQEVRQDIERALGVKLEQITIISSARNHIICLRLLSHPRITKFGMAETKDKAEALAMYNIIVNILNFLNLF